MGEKHEISRFLENPCSPSPCLPVKHGMSINLAGEKLALFIKNLDPKDSVKLRLKPTRSPEDKTLRLRVGRTLRRPETGVPFRVLVPS